MPAPNTSLFSAILGARQFAKRICGVEVLGRQTLRVVLACVLCTGAISNSASESEPGSIEIKGRYTYALRDTRTGAVLESTLVDDLPTSETLTFHTILNQNSWQTSVTNTMNQRIWTQLGWDGTNFFVLVPQVWPFIASKEVSGMVHASVSLSPYYLPSLSDMAYAVVPWMTYNLNPTIVEPDKHGLIGIPNPWETSRLSLLAYGWHWDIAPSECGRFVASCQVKRDSRLDFKRQSREFLRFELKDYPGSLEAKNNMLRILGVRRNIPDDFLHTDFHTRQWINTNGVTIPMASEMRTYQWPHSEHPFFTASLLAEEVLLHSAEVELVWPIEAPRVVEDYRYKRMGRTRIFPYATYELAPGEGWMSADDPELLAQAEHHMKHGPRYDHYESSMGHIVLWAFGLLVIAAPFLLLMARKKQVQK
jgi:hypothetical protein